MSMMTQHVLQPTNQSFERQVFESEVPVLVEFWAPWCPPCRLLKPVLGRVAERMAGRLKVAMVDVDQQPELAERFGVSSIPALMIVKDGEVVDAFTGYLAEDELTERVEVMIEE